MTTGRINQVCQMLLLTVLFHESMDQQSQTAAKTQSCSQLKEQHLNTHSKHCSVRGTHYLTPDAKAPAPTDRRRRHQPPARAWKNPCFAKSHCTHRVVMTTKSHSAGSAMEPPLYQRTRPPPEAREYELKWVSRTDAG